MHLMPAHVRWCALALLMLPWVWPLAIGPWPSTLPWLVSVTCGAALLLLYAWSRADVPALAAMAWLSAAVISSAIGLIQYAGLSANLAPFVNTTPLGEAFANLRQRNQFATLTNIGLAVAMAWCASGWAARSRPEGASVVCSPRHLLPLAGMAALLAVANAASSSRTGLMQLGVLLVLAWVWGWLRDRNTRIVLLAAGLAYGLAAVLLPRLAGLGPSAGGILARLQDGSPECASRLTLWDNVVQLIALKPWFGWGWGELDYAHFMTLYPGPRFCDILDNAHNLPLHLAVELGVPVAIVACGMGGWLVWRARPWKETQPVRQLAWAVLTLILAHSMLEYPLWYGPFQIAAALCIWVLWRTPLRAGATRLGSRLGVTTLAVATLTAAAYASWDYRRVSQIYLPSGERAAAYRVDTFDKVKDSWLFARQVRFAELTTTEMTPENASYVNAMAHDLLHFSPEARVVEKLIDSAQLLGREQETKDFMTRYEAAFPAAYASWVKSRSVR